jgi:hypothetical protein
MPVRTTPQSRIARARLAKSAQANGPESIETINARRDFAAARLDDYIRDTLAKAPPLSAQQRTALAELLRPARESIARDRRGHIADLDGS